MLSAEATVVSIHDVKDRPPGKSLPALHLPIRGWRQKHCKNMLRILQEVISLLRIQGAQPAFTVARAVEVECGG
jgi:hypothetical protein